MHLADAFNQNDLHWIQVILSVHAFPQTHDLGIAFTMLFCLSHRNAYSCLTID